MVAELMWTRTMPTPRWVRCVACVCGLAACSAQTPELRGERPSPDGVQFAREIYPLLLRDCAFSSCHGDEMRFLRVLGPGRVRSSGDIGPRDAPLLEEVQLSYTRASSMLATARDPEESLLLRKPLDISAGGQAHQGIDAFGQNIWRTRSDPRYELLRDWGRSEGEPPDAQTVEDAFAAAIDSSESDAAEEASP